MTETDPIIAGVELGGTKSIALIARGATILDQIRVPTTTPDATLPVLSSQIDRWARKHPVAALGIGSFGPLNLAEGSAGFGTITTTPKAGWADADIRGHFARRVALPIGFDTDVAGAALAEERWGAAAGCRVHVYVTIGTGIGAGVIVDGRPLHGLVHPEIGHLRLRRTDAEDFPGICPYHGDCLEGLASGPAIAARAGAAGATLGAHHPIWDSVAGLLAEFMAMLILTVSPERILIGGGVMQGQPMLLDKLRSRTPSLLNGYVAGVDENSIASLIRMAALGDRAGPLGAIALGHGILNRTAA